jgi:hypothetical protein
MAFLQNNIIDNFFIPYFSIFEFAAAKVVRSGEMRKK